MSRSATTLVFAGILAACVFAFFTPGGPAQGTHGIVFLVVGILMVAVAPMFRLPWFAWAAGGAVVAFSALSFLPAGKPEWRSELAEAGLDLGGMATPQPGLTFNYWIGLALGVIGALYILGFRVRSGERLKFVFLFVVAVGVYTVISMWSADTGTLLPWDKVDSFGLFPNRNHTATLLVMGAICGCGLVLHLAREGRWAGAVVSGIFTGLMVWSLLGYSASRAGVVLLVLAFAAWLAGLGRRFLDYRAIISIVVLGGLGLFVFLNSDSRVKERLTESPPKKTEDAGGLAGGQDVVDTASFDFRVLVYRDALSMLAAEPKTGVGLGNFRYVFPVYREQSISKSRCVHPESDWLWLAAESGILAALAALAGVSFILFRTVWKTRERKEWILRWSCFLAAAVVPFHGLFDVPGHRIGLAWTAFFLLALAAPFPKRSKGRAGPAERWGFRLAGVVFLLAGALLVRAEWLGGGDFVAALPEKTRAEVLRLYAEDAANQETLAEGETIAEGEDRIEVALGLLDETLEKLPLDSDLQFYRGALALFYDDKDDLAKQSFQIQRTLNPHWSMVPVHQAQSWIAISPERVGELWEEAIRRSEKVDHTSGDKTHVGTYEAIVEQAGRYGADEERWRLARRLAGNDPKKVIAWLAAAPLPIAESEVERITAAGEFSEQDRRGFQFRLQKRREQVESSSER